jgi:hypothetical protein
LGEAVPEIAGKFIYGFLHFIGRHIKLRAPNALAYIGPGLADMAVDVCCSELGLEATEKKFALPRRSAKIMLKLALMRLALHYGYQSASAAAASFRMR